MACLLKWLDLMFCRGQTKFTEQDEYKPTDPPINQHPRRDPGRCSSRRPKRHDSMQGTKYDSLRLNRNRFRNKDGEEPSSFEQEQLGDTCVTSSITVTVTSVSTVSTSSSSSGSSVSLVSSSTTSVSSTLY